MKCPKCKNQLEKYVFDREYDRPCPKCGYEYSHEEMQENMEPEDCLLVQNGTIDREAFDPDYHCQDCHEECILAQSSVDDWELTQDEEGNWGYDN